MSSNGLEKKPEKKEEKEQVCEQDCIDLEEILNSKLDSISKKLVEYCLKTVV